MFRFCLLLLIGSIFFTGCSSSDDDRPADDSTGLFAEDDQPVMARAEQLARESERSDATVWANERLAQRYEAEIVRLWDELRRSAQPRDVFLSRFPSTLTLGKVKDTESLGWDISRTRYLNPSDDAPLQIDRTRAGDYMTQLRRQGFRLVQSEWHHSSFRPATGERSAGGRPAESDVSFEILLHDAKGQAGLAKKRFRRTYSSSLVDLDGDGDLDLLVVSDFAGLDAYENDGRGQFREATDRWFAQRSGFGMSHTFGDFDGDGREDIYMVGMSSTTARRLDRLGLGRPDFPGYTKMRGPMTYGNRLLIAQGERFIQSKLSDQTARCGWAWGTAAGDFDNDADDDIYVANGHLSGRSARDYCTRFWCHDIYTGSSKKNAEVARFLSDEFRPLPLRGLDAGDISWNGYEHNKFFINDKGLGFHEVGPLLALASEADSRSVVAADLDQDGRQDLLVVSIRWARPERRTVARQSLHGWWNQLETANHWVGIDLQCRSGGAAPIGARVTIRGEFGQRTASVVTGDSYFSQHPTVVHFGLGDADRLDSIEVRWSDGSSSILENPEVDRYHVVLPAGVR